ncbi:TonB-dependent receptor plug domain-containing protein [Pelagicoccus sp. SDUM812003]|uniref:TonB-dependent receptor plug domain-containing protein n=1 Tax=Pelagicoccus sp. SDUM812003 TaxID=3041267 RepID=UPI0028107966|nr:TonB-dependent receptor plug domain-containing protein [Pelagicoccus sp. SDUM812003]MDQ8204604.1 outer membrane beta-barrel protein [Pelagicoccus sp. SDUM812003]
MSPFFLLSNALAQFREGEEPSLSELSLEELGKVPAVVSSKLPSQLFNAPTGSFVFDQDAIENLPVDSLPEMLRYAPGTHIVRPSNGIWGLGIRGINSRFFNRVQFTVDEQNVYSTIFAGLFGSQHDMLMEDVASVEVAYGPGGGTWDNNAVNGMVNVLMKTAFETEGTILETKLGTESRGVAGRVGWAIDESSSARVFVKGDMRDSSFTRFDYGNEWDTARAGFRYDKRPSSRDLISVSGEVFYSDLGYAYNLANFDTGALEFMADSETFKGANAQVKWTRNNSNDSAYSVRSWVAYSDMEAPYAAFGIATGGVEGRARIPLSDTQVLNVNLGGAYDEEYTDSTKASDFTSDLLHNFALYSGFQHEWELAPDQLLLSWGLDARYEDKSKLDTISPNARIIYDLDRSSRVWLSFSQAQRTTPVSLSVIDSLRSGKIVDEPLSIPTPGGPIIIDRNLTDARSNEELDTERLDALEIGYRKVFDDEKGSLSFNAFSYSYDEIFARIGISATPVLGVEYPYLDVQGSYTNLLKGDAYGFEVFGDWKVSDWLRTSFSYSRLVDSFESIVETDDPFVQSSIDFSLSEFDNSTPGHLATLNLESTFNSHWRMDTGLRYSSGYDFPKGYQPSIFQLDTRLTWMKSDHVRLSLVGRNLLDPYTQEARLKDFFGHWTEMKREVYLEVKVEF